MGGREAWLEVKPEKEGKGGKQVAISLIIPQSSSYVCTYATVSKMLQSGALLCA